MTDRDRVPEQLTTSDVVLARLRATAAEFGFRWPSGKPLTGRQIRAPQAEDNTRGRDL